MKYKEFISYEYYHACQSQKIVWRTKIFWVVFDIFRILPIVGDWREQWPGKCTTSHRLQDNSSINESSFETSFGRTSLLKRSFQIDQSSQLWTAIKRDLYMNNVCKRSLLKSLFPINSKHLMLTCDQKIRELNCLKEVCIWHLFKFLIQNKWIEYLKNQNHTYNFSYQ